MVAGAFNPSTWEAEAGGCLGVRGQPGLQELIPGQAPKLQRNPVMKKKKNKKTKISPDTAVLTFNPSAQEVGTEGSLSSRPGWST